MLSSSRIFLSSRFFSKLSTLSLPWFIFYWYSCSIILYFLISAWLKKSVLSSLWYFHPHPLFAFWRRHTSCGLRSNFDVRNHKNHRWQWWVILLIYSNHPLWWSWAPIAWISWSLLDASGDRVYGWKLECLVGEIKCLGLLFKRSGPGHPMEAERLRIVMALTLVRLDFISFI